MVSTDLNEFYDIATGLDICDQSRLTGKSQWPHVAVALAQSSLEVKNIASGVWILVFSKCFRDMFANNKLIITFRTSKFGDVTQKVLT